MSGLTDTERLMLRNTLLATSAIDLDAAYSTAISHVLSPAVERIVAAREAAAAEQARAEVVARFAALADEWDATVYKLPPGYPMTVNEFCRIWFKAPLRAALATEPGR